MIKPRVTARGGPKVATYVFTSIWGAISLPAHFNPSVYLPLTPFYLPLASVCLPWTPFNLPWTPFCLPWASVCLPWTPFNLLWNLSICRGHLSVCRGHLYLGAHGLYCQHAFFLSTGDFVGHVILAEGKCTLVVLCMCVLKKNVGFVAHVC